MLNIGWTPPTVDEEQEFARQRVANMLDEDAWKWLRARINDEWLTYPQIFQIIADCIE